jgi:hypothetical protein
MHNGLERMPSIVWRKPGKDDAARITVCRGAKGRDRPASYIGRFSDDWTTPAVL